MRILIAPDKFKGSLTAAEAAAAIAEGALRVYPDAVATQFPIADGGEGTLEAAVAAGYEERLNAVVGPILAPVGAAWALRRTDDGRITAVIETAQASGLASMEPTPENALRAHSYGCGQLIAAALDAGATEIVLGLGGSAMTDGGRDVNVEGAGAAGGFPASLLAFTGATLEGGFALVAGLTGLAEQLAGADLVITGEGSMDSQSLTGKAPIALADAAQERGIPVIVVAGRILVTPGDLAGHGVVAAAQLLDVAASPEDAVANAGKYLASATSQVLEGA